jgi:hypothetical protein
MDIVIITHTFHMLVDVVITNLICTGLVQCDSTTLHVVIVVAQDKA